MVTTVILGCGYTGKVLAQRLVAAGHRVKATTTTKARIPTLEALGVEPYVARLNDGSALKTALDGADFVVHLAPPDRERPIAEQVPILLEALAGPPQVFLYGSTTGAFGAPTRSGDWIDETTPSRRLGRWGQARLEYERALAAAQLPLKVLRIAGIYGPGRTIHRKLAAGSLVLFKEGPATSRIHVKDLAALLEAMLSKDAPPLAIGCDEYPCPTLEVARYIADLTGVALPEILTIEAAKEKLTPSAMEMRLSGRRCRSLVRPKLMPRMQYPTYREGIRAALTDEGVL